MVQRHLPYPNQRCEIGLTNNTNINQEEILLALSPFVTKECECRHLSYSTSLARSRAGYTSAISLSPTQCHNVINSGDKGVYLGGIKETKSWWRNSSWNTFEPKRIWCCLFTTADSRAHYKMPRERDCVAIPHGKPPSHRTLSSGLCSCLTFHCWCKNCNAEK